MNKSTLILCAVITAFSLTAYGFNYWSNTETNQEENSYNKSDIRNSDVAPSCKKQAKADFFYEVSHRFINTITKDKLHRAKSIVDILPKKATKGIESFQNVKVVVLPETQPSVKMSDNEVLNFAQMNLLKSSEYSTNFYIRADYKRKNADTGDIEDQYLIYYMTVIPEKEAEFKEGQSVLLNYLKENSQEETANVNEYELKPGKVRFTVTKNGVITNVELESTSGYVSVDDRMVELITTMPGKWKPATNSKGEKVDQQLVYSFGKIGC